MAVAPTPRPASPENAWPAPEELRGQAPIIRLISSIWAVPGVTRIGVTVGDGGVNLWVFMERDDYAAEAAISQAERTYLNATLHRSFELQVIPGDGVSTDALPPYETIIER